MPVLALLGQKPRGLVFLHRGPYIKCLSLFYYRSVPMNVIVAMEVNGACGTEDEVYDNLWDKSELYSKVIAHVHIEQKMKYMTTYRINLSYSQR